ncbi:PREDICTED: probable F-box protein At4g22165 [Camelina sativa]|uniref:Probable F-box protein At4g22165 n=1 Tax=Camelina sativa TaxID=90675 RepID=A0ABM1QKS6_CAMSA|nr:PREDICTED: probable F-box protein At4g22165 [Camelina sativa]
MPFLVGDSFRYLVSVLERLNSPNFERAKSVCLSWYSASRQCVPNPKYHISWLIPFPKDRNNNSRTLFNPEEKQKRYNTQDLGVGFANSVCIATCGSWLLMQDPLIQCCIVNLFTRERRDLPSLESQLGMLKVERIIDERFRISHDTVRVKSNGMIIKSPAFWIDEKTKDHIVFWGLRDWCVVYAKKGDTSWNQIPNTSYCSDMVYKDHKLYFLNSDGGFKILDFSDEIPQRILKRGMFRSRLEMARRPSRNNKLGGRLWLCRRVESTDYWVFSDPKLVVTIRGDVLKVIMKQHNMSKEWSFSVTNIYKSSGKIKKYKRVDSLGDEAMLLDLGITVPSCEIDGLNGNSIYFSGCRGRPKTNGIFIFSLETKKLEQLHKYDCLSLKLDGS